MGRRIPRNTLKNGNYKRYIHFGGRAAFHDECGLQCARFFRIWMIKFCHFRRRNAIKIQIMIHPIKAARTAALCWVFSIVQRKDRLSGGTAPQGFPAG